MIHDPLYFILAIIVLYILNLAYSNWRLYQMGKFIKQTYPEEYQKILQPRIWSDRPFPFNTRGMKHSNFGLLKAQAEKIGRVGNEVCDEKLIAFSQRFYRNFQIRIWILLLLIVIIYFVK